MTFNNEQFIFFQQKKRKEMILLLSEFKSEISVTLMTDLLL